MFDIIDTQKAVIEWEKCDDCNNELINEAAYYLNLGFLGDITICYDCMTNRNMNVCDDCNCMYDNSELTFHKTIGIFCNICKEDHDLT